MKQAADMILNGADLSLTNAIQLLAKSVEANPQQDVRSLASLVALHNNLQELLNQVSDAVFIVSFSGEILYKNSSATLFLIEKDTAALWQQFLPKNNNDFHSLNASIEYSKSVYQVQYNPVVWGGQSAVSMQFSKGDASTSVQLEEKTATLLAFIQAETIPYLLLKDNVVIAWNESFKKITQLKEEILLTLPLNAIVQLEKETETFENFKKQKRYSTHLKLIDNNNAVSFAQTDLVFNKHIFSLCSFQEASAKMESDSLSTHRILEIASHDMREPVRTSIGYLQLLQEGFKKEKNEKLQGFSESALVELARLELLLSDMKFYISQDAKVIKKVKVNMKTIAESVLKDLKKKIDATDSMVNISGLPEVNADADSMKLLLGHLVDNALKFQQKDKRPYVEILAIKEKENIQFCVKDNGIGVAAPYHEIIFEPFKRLNRSEDFPGTGIGLSVCKKIIAAHGGSIWVESKEGFGSSFFFILSAA